VCNLRGLLGICLLLVSVAACNSGTAEQQIALPDGDPAKGQLAFAELQCTACHSVRDVNLPLPEHLGPVTLELGGKVSKVKSYGELVTSVINPSHRLARNIKKQQIDIEGESIMPVYNDVMTVSQLIDIVAFLQPQYTVVRRPTYRYPVYTYGNQ
jgi:L-cysteine S-thiosulfotransferase